jgi:hypothetical protein
LLIKNPENPPLWASLLAGGISGVFTWTGAYPLDYLKTLIQTDSLDNPKHKGVKGYFQE